MAELKRKQTTAVVLLGVIGAEFGQDIMASDNIKKRSSDERRKGSVVEGFGMLVYKYILQKFDSILSLRYGKQ